MIIDRQCLLVSATHASTPSSSWEGEAPAAPQRATIHVARRLTRRFALPWSRAVRAFRFVLIAATVIASVVAPHKTSAQDAFADAVAAYAPGVNGGFNAANLPNIVLGPPHGSGAMQGSFDVLALGIGGAIVLRFDAPVICDGPGGDFTVFENAFHSGSPAGPVFAEYGYVAVSQDGEHFTEFPYDASTHVGLAGQTPVLSNPDNDIDPLDPTMSGGDAFDLAAVGLAWAAYVRITDVGGAIADPGDLPQFTVAPNAGFDLDAIAAVHACDPGALPTPTATASATPPSLTATFTPTATAPAPQHDAAVLARRPVRVRVRNGHSSAIKRVRIKVRNMDASGNLAIRLGTIGCPAVTAAIDFDRATAGLQESVGVRAGKAESAIVTLTLEAAAVNTPDLNAPVMCSLALTASADVPGNVDPNPSNDRFDLQLQLLDLNDAP